MNILHINSEKNWRGGEMQLAYIVRELHGKNTHSSVVGKKGSDLEKWCSENKIDFYPINLNNPISAAFKIKNLSKKLKIDILHPQTSKASTASVLAKYLGAKSKLLVHRHVAFHVKNNFFSRLKYTSKHVDSLVCVSACSLKTVTDSVGEKVPLPKVIFPGTDPDRLILKNDANALFEKLGIAHEDPIVINTSAITEEKDHITFVNTAKNSLAEFPNIHFIVAGKGKLLDDIQAHINKLGIEKNVHLLGHIEDVAPLFDRAKVFLMTSSVEGVPTSIMDAFSSNIPVVTTDSGGTSEVVHHKKTGMLAPVKADAELATYISELLHNDALYQHVTTHAKQFYDEHLHYAQMVKKIYQVYEEILAE